MEGWILEKGGCPAGWLEVHCRAASHHKVWEELCQRAGGERLEIGGEDVARVRESRGRRVRPWVNLTCLENEKLANFLRGCRGRKV